MRSRDASRTRTHVVKEFPAGCANRPEMLAQLRVLRQVTNFIREEMANPHHRLDTLVFNLKMIGIEQNSAIFKKRQDSQGN